MCQLSFNEITNERQFEELTACYFRNLANIPGNYINQVEVEVAGYGPDGGVDLLVHIRLYDGLRMITRTYIIQCKFHNTNIGRSSIKTPNITELIMAYGACGYLLICRKMATSSLKQLFSRLGEHCINNYTYQVWSGEEFLGRLHEAPDILIRQFFPRYFNSRLTLPYSS